MKITLLPVFLAIFLVSCATDIGALKPFEPSGEDPAVEPSGEDPSDEIPISTITKEPEIPIPEYIMGDGLMDAKIMTKFLLASNPGAEEDFVDSLSEYYVKEAAVEGINHDVAFSQMCLETGYLNYGGLVTPEMYNFCGLGAISDEQPGESFEDALTGVRAHIQHLKAYASEEPLKQVLVDPRYYYVRRGSSPMIEDLAGTWATDKNYAEKINRILERLYQFSTEDI